jgi:chemotaxis protein MotB
MSEFEVQDTPPEGAPDWIVTFADLMSLLLTFFVLLLSFSNMEIVKFRTMAGSVRNALGLKSEFDMSDIPMGSKLLPYEDPKEGEGDPSSSQGLREALEAMLRDAGLPEKASVRMTSRGVALYIEGDILFDSGSAALRPEAWKILDRIGEMLPRVGYRVDVQGHSDSVPIATPAFPSNWELSAARAGRAVRYFVEKGVPSDRFRAIGLAETRPVASNDTAEGRANNRRVEFLFVNPPPVQPAPAFLRPGATTPEAPDPAPDQPPADDQQTAGRGTQEGQSGVINSQDTNLLEAVSKSMVEQQ